MAKRPLFEQLDKAVEVILADPTSVLPRMDARLVPLARVAVELRDLPRASFKTRLKTDLQRRVEMSVTQAPAIATSGPKPAVSPIRAGFHSVTPYLVVRGAAPLLDFLKQAFGAQELLRVPRPDGTIMHAEVRIGDSMLELADGNPQYPTQTVALHLYVEDVDAVYQRALQAGAVSSYVPTNQDYRDREAGVKDPSGNSWYIATHQGARFLPEGLRSITPYLHPRGAAAVVEFLKQAFGAEEVARHQSPEGIIHHAKIRIGDSIVEMGEAHGEYQPQPATLHMYVEDCDALYERALRAGATSLSAPADQSYGDRSAGVVDPSGNRWFIATHIKDVQF
ncbi:MAG TPA: VOC family protein [Terriglobales bacterium]|nr:VOC family protein [Terriglobales bacterium]